jgi:predicted SprT family Zn-dependent metalloprotease
MSKLQQFETLVKLCIEAAEEKYGKLPPIRIRFDLKGRAAGQAGYRGTHFFVRFNVAAMNIDWDHMVKETIPHEIAHIVAYAKPELGAKGHNAGWKRIAWSLGCKGERCHTMPLPPARASSRQRYFYRTEGGTELLVGPKHHARIQAMGKSAGIYVKKTREYLDRHHYQEGATLKIAA